MYAYCEIIYFLYLDGWMDGMGWDRFIGWMASFNITITTIAFCFLMFDRHSKNVPNL